MRNKQTFDGRADMEDIPQPPRKVLAPVSAGAAPALAFYVTLQSSGEKLHGPGTADDCTTFARSEARKRAAKVDVREAGSRAVFFSFNEKGEFA